EARPQPVGERPGDGRFRTPGIVVAGEGAHFNAKLVGGTLQDCVDRTADGTASGQGALRPAQDFRALDENRPAPRVLHRAGVDAVDVVRNGAVKRVDVGLAGNAANGGTVGRSVVGNAGREIGHVLDGQDTNHV